MDLISLIFSFAIAIVITLVFSGLVGNTGPWKGFWPFFLIIFLVILAAGAWVIPIGPPFYDFYWVPGVIVGILVALLIVSIYPKPESKDDNTTPTYDLHNQAADIQEYKSWRKLRGRGFGASFWLLVMALILIIFFGFFNI
jgi:hypothetical protein